MLNKLTLKQYLNKVEAKEISPDEVWSEINAQIDIQNPELNIFLARGKPSKADGPLRGAPLAIKDNFLTEDMKSTASAKILQNFKPPYESTVTRKLHEAGANIIGKTNMDAWAHGSSTETSDFGATKNPRNPEYLPGGSSGGSAAAVAADLCIAAIGSETAGSIRQPAAWCGVVGLKPTYGRVSRYGVVAMGSSLDCPGPMTKTVEDSAILLNHIAGHDPKDGTTSPAPVPDFTKHLGSSIKGMRIGVCYLNQEKIKGTLAAEATLKAAKKFEALGAQVEMVSGMLDPDIAIGVYTILQRAEVSSNLARYDGIRYGTGRENFGEEAKRRIMLGTYTLSKGHADQYYAKAQQVRTLFIDDYRKLFGKYDLLISPTSPGFALKLGASKNSPMFGELEDMLVEPSSITGLPGINVPMYHDPKTNLYLGLNIVAPMWHESEMLKAAYAYEQL